MGNLRSDLDLIDEEKKIYVIFDINTNYRGELYIPIFMVCDTKEQAEETMEKYSGNLYLTMKEFTINKLTENVRSYVRFSI